MKRILAILLAAVMLFAMFAGCGAKEETPAADAPAADAPAADAPAADAPAADAPAAEPVVTDQTFTVGTTYSHLYMYTAGSGESDNYCRRLVYDQIFYIDDITGEMSSDILESYEWTDDYTLKLTLKDGVTFSDGTKMTAEDILYTLEAYILNTNSETEFFQRIDFEKSTTEGELTAVIVYSEVYGAAISTLTIPVLSKAFCEAHPDGDDAWWYSPVGSGPYEVGEVVMGTSVEFVRRDDYWNADAVFPAAKIVVKYYSDTTAQYADYVAGELDAIIGLSSTQVDELRLADSTEVVVKSADDVCMLAFNNNTVDPAIREAIAYGVDWDAVALAAFGNLYTPATSHYASTFEAYTDHSGTYTYDVEKAKQILADAGITGAEFSFPCFAGSTDPIVGEALQFYLAELGITLTINEMDIPTLIPTLIGGGGDLSLQSTAANGNAPKEVNTVVSPLAATGFQIMAISDPEFNDLLAQGLNTTDNAERVEVYKKIDQWLFDNNQVIPICERGEAYCFNNAKIASFSIASVTRGSLAFVTFN